MTAAGHGVGAAVNLAVTLGEVSRTTHVRVYQEDRGELLRLANEWQVTVPDVIRSLLSQACQVPTLDERVEALEKKLGQETERLERCIRKDRREIYEMQGELAELFRLIQVLGKKVGLKIERKLASNEMPAEPFLEQKEGGH